MTTESGNTPDPEPKAVHNLKWVFVDLRVLDNLLDIEDQVAPDSERGRVERRIWAGHSYMLCNQRVTAIVRILRGIAMCRPRTARLNSILRASPEWENELRRDAAKMAELGKRLRIYRPEKYNAFLTDLPVRIGQVRKGLITPHAFYDFIAESSPELLKPVFSELEHPEEVGRPKGRSPQQYVGELLVKGRRELETRTKLQILDQDVIPQLKDLEDYSPLAKRALNLINNHREASGRPFHEVLYRWEKSYLSRSVDE